MEIIGISTEFVLNLHNGVSDKLRYAIEQEFPQLFTPDRIRFRQEARLWNGTKYCNHCKETLPAKEFRITRSKHKVKLYFICKPCEKIYRILK